MNNILYSSNCGLPRPHPHSPVALAPRQSACHFLRNQNGSWYRHQIVGDLEEIFPCLLADKHYHENMNVLHFSPITGRRDGNCSVLFSI